MTLGYAYSCCQVMSGTVLKDNSLKIWVKIFACDLHL